MSAGNRGERLPLLGDGGQSLGRNLDSSPPSYESVMRESYGGRPYAPLPTSSTEHRDTTVAQTHPTNPPYPTLDRPLLSNPDYNRSDPRNETRPPSAPYPTNESVYIPSLPTSSSAFYNPMNQMPSPSGPGISQPTGETTQSPANLQIGFKVPERIETPTVSPQYPDVDRGSRGCHYVKFCIVVVILLLIIVGILHFMQSKEKRRRMRIKANDDFSVDSPYHSAGRYSDGFFQNDGLLQ